MADEPERRIVGAIHAELEKQKTDGNLETLGYLNTDGLITVQGELDLYLLAEAILKEVGTVPRPRLIEYDLPVRQTADLVEEPEPTTWYVPMRPRNLSSAVWEFVQVEAPTAEEALSKAISAKPGHAWRSPTKVEE